VERFEQSGVSQEAFARRHQIGLSTLSKWVKEARTGSVPSEPVSLREVNFGQMLGSPAWVAELSRKDGTVVRLTANVRGDMIERLLRA
jgi:transposase-like protein